MHAYVICAETTCHYKYQYSEVLDTGVPLNQFFRGCGKGREVVNGTVGVSCNLNVLIQEKYSNIDTCSRVWSVRVVLGGLAQSDFSSWFLERITA
jgi:hypothetical protein